MLFALVRTLKPEEEREITNQGPPKNEKSKTMSGVIPRAFTWVLPTSKQNQRNGCFCLKDLSKHCGASE